MEAIKEFDGANANGTYSEPLFEPLETLILLRSTYQVVNHGRWVGTSISQPIRLGGDAGTPLI